MSAISVRQYLLGIAALAEDVRTRDAASTLQFLLKSAPQIPFHAAIALVWEGLHKKLNQVLRSSECQDSDHEIVRQLGEQLHTALAKVATSDSFDGPSYTRGELPVFDNIYDRLVGVGPLLPGIDGVQFPEQIETAKKTTTASKKPRRPRHKTVRPVTERQADVTQRVAEANGDMQKVAKDLGISRQAVEKTYKAALKKVGKTPPPKPKKTKIPSDTRQQDVLSEPDPRMKKRTPKRE